MHNCYKSIILLFVLIASIMVMAGCTTTSLTSISQPTTTASTSTTATVSSVTITTTTATQFIFDYPPVDLDKVGHIEPMGSMIGSHVTPIDHQYYYAPDFANQEIVIDVYSPADGTIINMQHMTSFDSSYDDYRLVIQHTATISSIYIHIDNLSEKIYDFAPRDGGYVNVKIPVLAGEVIGNYSGSVDYNVVDEDVVLAGFVNPESYWSEPWKIHTPDPFDYFNETIKSRLIELCLRTAEPVGGKIDHDINGRLVGNWFEEGTNGYGGIGLREYWVGHLAIAYSSVDPDHIIVSFGNYSGQTRQFGVKGNSPDPADVSVETGLVKYELVDYDFYVGDERWDRSSLAKGLELRNNDDYVHGVVLFQIIEDGKLKVEIFPGKTAEDVAGFTDDAFIYIR